MTDSFGNRIRETAQKAGSVYTLLGAIAGRQTWVGGGQTGIGRFYCAAKGVDFELGIGTVSAMAGTLTVTSVLSSSRGGAQVPFVGVLEIFNTIPAEYLAALEAAIAGKADATHTHSAADLVSGIIPDIARIASGTPDGTKFVADDRTLKTPVIALSSVAPAALVGTFKAVYGADLGLGLSNNDPVTTWPDQTANGLDLTSIASATDRPTYLADPDGDGIPCVRFDGTNDGLRRRAMTAYTGTDLTMFLVARVNQRNASRGIFRLDDQTHGTTAAQNATIAIDTGNYFGTPARNGASALLSAIGSGGGRQQGSDACFLWTVFCLSWGTVGGNYVLRLWDTGSRTGSNVIASTALAFTRVSIGGAPNDTTDAFANWCPLDVRFAGWCETQLREDQVKSNLQYLANRYKVGGVL